MAGFQPISTLTGAPWNGQARQYPLDMTLLNAYPLNAGDPVCQVATGGVSPATTALLVTGQIIGVFVGCSYKLVGQLEVTNASYFPGPNGGPYDPSYPPYANVVDDPNVLYSLQVDGGNSLILTNVGNNAQYAFPGSPSTTGQSGVLLTYGSLATTSTLPLRVLGIAPDSITITDPSGNTYVGPNAFGLPNNHALVSFNVHAYKSVGTPGV